MTEKATGISTKNADTWIATFEANQSIEGHTRLVQIVSLTSGKIPNDIGTPIRTVSSNDSLDLTTVSGILTVGDGATLVCYTQHSQLDGSCLVTPLLCDATKTVGCLPSKKSQTLLGLQTGGNYISPGLSWDIKSVGAISVFPHIDGLSSNNTVTLWLFSI